jgi:hypothetical protein
VQCSVVQCSAVKCSVVQCSAVKQCAGIAPALQDPALGYVETDTPATAVTAVATAIILRTDPGCCKEWHSDRERR